ncbi:MAG: OmpA family protein [Taibaiella sp.]|nr:OmpA family protein [Taibaiella sp.]
MKKLTLQIICFSLCLIFLSSCVAKRKYVAARNRANENEKEIANLNGRINTLNGTINDLNGNITGMKEKIGELGYENQQTSNELNMNKEQIAAQRQRMRQLQTFIAQQQQATEGLRKKIADALTGFNSNELTIAMKNGRVYISMQENLLFPSGSAALNPKGKEALAKVANVLNSNTDININIEGHTDSIAIHNKTYADNWSLSTARATSIAHVLIDEYKVIPKRLVASGRSYYDPIAANETPAGRSLNRRTEIILEPKLDELMDLMNNGGMANGK